jgi:hypothetical protein
MGTSMPTSETSVEESKSYNDSWRDKKARLLREINELQEIFECPVRLDMLGEDALFTPEGNCIGKEALIEWVSEHHTHPIHGTTLELKDCISRDDFKTILRSFKSESAIMADALETMTEFTASSVSEQFDEFRAYAERQKDAFEEVRMSFNQFNVANMTERLLIDKNNIAHLKYWDSKNHRCFHGHGGVAVTHAESGETFRVPTRVYEMMRVAAEKHSSNHAFKLAIEKARTHRASFFSNPFAFMTRDNDTAQLYNQKLENISITLK